MAEGLRVVHSPVKVCPAGISVARLSRSYLNAALLRRRVTMLLDNGLWSSWGESSYKLLNALVELITHYSYTSKLLLLGICLVTPWFHPMIDCKKQSSERWSKRYDDYYLWHVEILPCSHGLHTHCTYVVMLIYFNTVQPDHFIIYFSRATKSICISSTVRLSIISTYIF